MDRGSGQGELLSVAATSPTNAWAVGTAYHGQTQAGPLVEHWNGHAWQTAAAIPGSSGIGLDLVAASASNNVWTVGSAPLATDVKIFRT